jgi:YjjG family noncanonical pyrimidine nucleotidase
VKTITDIFFDLDHTLWDFDTNSKLAFGRIFGQRHPQIATIDFLEKYIPINQACWKLFQVDLITHEELRYNRLRKSFDAINYEISDTEIDRIANEYLQFLPDFNHLFEDAVETLEYLNERYKLHIITNGFAETQFKKINNSNLAQYFKSITNSEMAGAKKPNPVIFEHALNLGGAKKESSIMIGDCLEADVKGALDFGMRAIYFNPNNTEAPENTIQITTLAQLKTLF